jgi:voltage-gated potassium channel Kch
MGKRISERTYWRFLLGAGGLAVLFSVTGWVQALAAAGQTPTPGRMLDIAVGTVQLFTGGTPAVPGAETPRDFPVWLRLAQVLAPLVTAGAVLRIGLEVLTEQRAAWRIGRLSGHTVICGHGDTARAFARSERDADRPVVLVDPAAGTDGVDADLRRMGVELKAADPLDRHVLETVGVHNAGRLIVAPENDNRTLDIAGRAASVCADLRGGDADTALPANLEISSRRLWHPLSRFQGLAPARTRSDAPGAPRHVMDPLPFNMAALAAREVIWRERLEAHALLRDQDRAHIVLIGYDDFTEALIGYLPPALVHPALAPPVISVLTADPGMAEARLAQSFPELVQTPDSGAKPAEVRDMERRLGPVADVRVFPFRADLDRLNGTLMADIAGHAPVTAVFVSQDHDADSLRTAMIVQNRMRQENQWHAPVNVRLSRCQGMEDFLTGSGRAKRFGHVIQPFGVEDRLCRIAVLEGRMDILARRIHHDYMASRRDPEAPPDPNLSRRARAEWSALGETFRDSNRRAADHIFAKLTTAGCHVPEIPVTLVHEDADAALPVPPGFTLLPRDTAGTGAECLAESEHLSWNAGRRLDGWRYDRARDDDRQWQPNLVPFRDLKDRTKQFDRNQVALLRVDGGLLTATEAQKDRALIRHDLWVGLIGKLILSAAERDWLWGRSGASPLRAALRDAVAPHPQALVTLVTSLAPGADVVMTRVALDLLAEMGRPHRLIVVEGVPPGTLLDDYAAKIGSRTDAVDGFDPPPGDGQTSWRDHLNDSRAAMIGAAATDWVVDLYAPTARMAARGEATDHGHRRAARYVAGRSHVLIAVDRTDPAESSAPPAPGGVTDTLAWRRARRAALPDMDGALLGLAPAALSPFPQSEAVVIDLADRPRA